MRHHYDAADQGAESTVGHGETQFILEQRSRVKLAEAMVVLERRETAGDHSVLKEERAVVVGDLRYVVVPQAELPAFPADQISFADEALGAAADCIHSKLLMHDGDAGGEQEATVDGRMDDDRCAKRKQLCGSLRQIGAVEALIHDISM